jgi:hypothetical protein
MRSLQACFAAAGVAFEMAAAEIMETAIKTFFIFSGNPLKLGAS